MYETLKEYLHQPEVCLEVEKNPDFVEYFHPVEIINVTAKTVTFIFLSDIDENKPNQQIKMSMRIRDVLSVSINLTETRKKSLANHFNQIYQY
jgi:hypothetical protein